VIGRSPPASCPRRLMLPSLAPAAAPPASLPPLPVHRPTRQHQTPRRSPPAAPTQAPTDRPPLPRSAPPLSPRKLLGDRRVQHRLHHQPDILRLIRDLNRAQIHHHPHLTARPRHPVPQNPEQPVHPHPA